MFDAGNSIFACGKRLGMVSLTHELATYSLFLGQLGVDLDVESRESDATPYQNTSVGSNDWNSKGGVTDEACP